MRKKPLDKAHLAMLVADIKSNHTACEGGDHDNSFFTMGAADWCVDRLIDDGHAVVYKVWPTRGCAWIRDLIIDSVPIVKGGVLCDEEGIPALLNREKR